MLTDKPIVVKIMQQNKECALCERVCILTFHHLIPRKLHRRGFFKAHYSKTQLQTGVMLCTLCHKTIHRFYDEMTLGKKLNTLTSLKADEKIQTHIHWAKKQKT